MTNDEFQATNLPEDKTAKNIRFLRKSIGLSIAGLAALIEIDAINLYEYEKDDYEFSSEKGIKYFHRLDDIIDIANYFAIKLDVLVLNDIEKEGPIDKKWFEHLKNELNKDVKADRKEFYKEVIDYEEELPEEFTREDFMRKTLRQLHQIHKLQNRYYNLRDADKIDKIDFFE